LAGARVDRIAANAAANKQAIYAYFGSKETLFDAVLLERTRVLADVVPFTPDDLAGYTGALFDVLIADPRLQRLTQWKMLERPDVTEQELGAHLSKARALVDHYGVDAETAMDALMFALAAALSWNTTATEIRNPNGADPAKRAAQHRAAIVAAVTAMAAATLGCVLPPSRKRTRLGSDGGR
jgi:AcrR family transcriptional regulator